MFCLSDNGIYYLLCPLFLCLYLDKHILFRMQSRIMIDMFCSSFAWMVVLFCCSSVYGLSSCTIGESRAWTVMNRWWGHVPGLSRSVVLSWFCILRMCLPPPPARIIWCICLYRTFYKHVLSVGKENKHILFYTSHLSCLSEQKAWDPLTWGK
jgi:hypothetical protein